MSATTTDNDDAIAALSAAVDELREELREVRVELIDERIRLNEERLAALREPPAIRVFTGRRLGRRRHFGGR
ncbi:MAG TPA: hypothetical protein VLK58_04965 [Conexibacter sp.]|nr:hypothetical protein [Conexibacter sp.]